MGRKTTEKVGDVSVQVEYKAVKHLHLSVHPPEGTVKAVVPINTDSEKARLFIVSRLAWIKRRQRAIADQPRKLPPQFTDGESAFLWGKQYRIRLQSTAGRHHVKTKGGWLEIWVRPGTDRRGRQRTLRRYYREELMRETPHLAQKWEKRTGLRASEYKVKLMYTKWGSCNPDAGRIWLNLELAKHNRACLSYLILHELLHLQIRQHTSDFKALLTKYLPTWRSIRDELNNDFPGLPIRE
ncbi:SprT family zinc-dependent metalloprotease [Lewinella sp. W8]|uniref:M48 family metallopeptidase n=1 Tax=Lewinella sp. W8 TaxID=2528208 RepID=UPI00106833A4|nr:DUF45 domain-containing protein [Lewinella sp. W8]